MLKIDEFEPIEIEALVRAVLQDVIRVPLNRAGYADYVWDAIDGSIEQIERKQVSEILGGMEHTEYQLLKESATSPNLTLIIEGVVQPVPGGTQIFILSPNGSYMRQGKKFKVPYARYESWRVGLIKAGILVWPTPSLLGTVEAIIRLYTSSQNPEHTTMRRHLKVTSDFHPNSNVQSLMGIKGADIGAKLGENLIEIFGTMWDVLRQEPQTIANFVPGIGLTKAKTILKAVGRVVK